MAIAKDFLHLQYQVSIHAPPEGRDKKALAALQRDRGFKFQSTRPRRGAIILITLL